MNLIFTWDDLKRIVKAKQRQILRFGICSALITFLYFLMSPLQYEAWATFKQASSRGETSIDLKNLIRSFTSGGAEGASTTLMLSDTVLGKTVEELGLQVEVKASSSSILPTILAELGVSMKDPDVIRFSKVSYAGEKPLKMFFQKTSETEYALFDEHHVFLQKGMIGLPVVSDLFCFTLDHFPASHKQLLVLHPIQSAIKNLREKLIIKPTREDRNLLLLKCTDTQRKRSAEILNTLMAMYERYLVEENKMVIGAQLSYLKERQDELSSKLHQDIEEHAKVLKHNLQTQGFLGIKDEMESVLEPLQNHKLRLEQVELELLQIDQRLSKTALDLHLSQKKPLLIERYSKALGDQIGSARELLDQVRLKEKIAKVSIEELQQVVQEFNGAIESADSEKIAKTEMHLHEFMQHLMLREKSLRESSEWIESVQNDLEGISLDSARKQFDRYSTQFDTLHGELKQVLFMRDHLFDPHFEMSTLTNILNDSVTEKMIQRSSELEAQLHDDIHRSLRDRDRLKASLSIHKRFLESHLTQTLELGKIRIDLLKEKLHSLYVVMKTLLKQEQEILKGKIAELQQSMQTLPELWVHENHLKFKSDLTKGMMEGLVSIAETKNLSHHLYQVESRPLDRAKYPLGFTKPLLLTKATLAFILASFVCALFAIMQAFLRGFPVSLATLKALGAHISGALSLQPDTGRETLRRVADFLQDKGVVAVIGEKQNFFLPALTALLQKHHRTSCVIDCSFGKIVSIDEKPGLYQVLKGSSTPDVLQTHPSYSFLSVGASSSEGVELLKSNTMKHLVQSLSSQFDFIFLVSRTAIPSLESRALLDQSTHAIFSAEIPLDHIQEYLDPSRQKEKIRVTFIQFEGM